MISLIRPEVLHLKSLGPLPNNQASAETVESYNTLLRGLIPPVSDQEAEILAELFGVDDCYGMAWALVHLIELAPNWPIEKVLVKDNYWIRLLKRKAGV